ncbi:MAG: hypothetical protein IPJ81_16955 [Chitinophagaceae bacterium]|nr:hypothetical protein [Chitinophagaceae bacterium]
MKLKLLSTLLLSIFILSCTGDTKKTVRTEPAASSPGTYIGSKDVTDEITGSAYTKRAKAYFMITDKDTSGFICNFSENKEDGEIVMAISNDKEKLSYQQRMNEMAKILPVAAKDFPFDSLRSVYIGRLVSTGDLAIDITNEYTKKFGGKAKASDNEIVFLNNKSASAFLLESKLATDFNTLFKPYSLTVSHVSVEKVFFTSKESIYLSSKVEKDTTSVPDKILDAMIWLDLK